MLSCFILDSVPSPTVRLQKTEQKVLFLSTHGKISFNLSCLMKNSASWQPISTVSGCPVTKEGGCWGWEQEIDFGPHCIISIIARNGPATQHICCGAFAVHHTAVRSHSRLSVCICVCTLWVRGVAAYVMRGEGMSSAANCGMTALQTWGERGLIRVSGRDVEIKLPVSLGRDSSSSPSPNPPPHPWGGAANRRRRIRNIAADGQHNGFVKSCGHLCCFCHWLGRYNTSVRKEGVFFFLRQGGGQWTGLRVSIIYYLRMKKITFKNTCFKKELLIKSQYFNCFGRIELNV